jgi:hypothetical protein
MTWQYQTAKLLDWESRWPELVARQLERRFGPLPNSVKKLLGQAEAETVEQWGLRLMDAHSIEDIFGSALNQKPQRARRAAAAT